MTNIETAIHQTLSTLLNPVDRPEPGRERFRVTWYDPSTGQQKVERFNIERVAHKRFMEILAQGRRSWRDLRLVQRGRNGDWLVRSSAKNGPAGTSTRGAGPARAQATPVRVTPRAAVAARPRQESLDDHPLFGPMRLEKRLREEARSRDVDRMIAERKRMARRS